jgi:hypothetical protein
VKATYRINMEAGLCENFITTFNQDNDKSITAHCEDGNLVIIINDLKISSLYNMTDDILRNLGTFEKIYEKK